MTLLYPYLQLLQQFVLFWVISNNLSRQEYDELLAATDKSLEKELVIQEILEKIILKQEENPDNFKFNPELGITAKLKGGFTINLK